MAKEFTFTLEAGNAKKDQSLKELEEMGVNVDDLIKEINERTKFIKGMKVKVTVLFFDKIGKYHIRIETPKVTEILRRKVNFSVKRKNKKGVDIFSQQPGSETVGSISLKDIIEIAKIKMDELNTNNLKSAVKCIVGTCLSCGILVENKNPKDVLKEIDEGKYDNLIK